MIESVTRTGATYAELPYKFEAGTGNAAGAVGLHAAIRYMQSVGFDTMHERETALVARMMAGMADMPFIHVLGSGSPKEHSGIVTFTVDGVHPHDVSEILAADGVCIRAGHHCAQPLLKTPRLFLDGSGKLRVLQHAGRGESAAGQPENNQGANGLWKTGTFITKF